MDTIADKLISTLNWGSELTSHRGTLFSRAMTLNGNFTEGARILGEALSRLKAAQGTPLFHWIKRSHEQGLKELLAVKVQLDVSLEELEELQRREQLFGEELLVELQETAADPELSLEAAAAWQALEQRHRMDSVLRGLTADTVRLLQRQIAAASYTLQTLEQLSERLAR